jgi:transcriptional regulator with XRE-family HTH domain
MPKTIDEKKEFAVRLKQALGRSPKKVLTATDLSVQFNLRHPNESITVQAAQKWLTGTARPTADKIETLAKWLKVSAQWLRYGIAEERSQSDSGRKPKMKTAAAQPTEEELALLEKLRSLSEHRRYLIAELIDQLEMEQEMWR